MNNKTKTFCLIFINLFAITFSQNPSEFIEIDGIVYVRNDIQEEFRNLQKSSEEIQESIVEFEDKFNSLEEEARELIKDWEVKFKDLKKEVEIGINKFIILLMVIIVLNFIIIIRKSL